MNRDERRTRARGIPPAPQLVRRVLVLMPTDPEGGGSWISVNQLRMSLALLNRYEESPQDPAPGGAFTSRGLLVRELAWASGPNEVAREFESMPLQPYRPFTLACQALGGVPNLFEWDGRRLARSTVPEPGLVRASSGSDQAQAEQVRGELFRAGSVEPGGLTAATLERLHRSHLPERGAISICMHREEAQSVSLSLITATEKTASIYYVNGPPGETPHGLLETL
jgi:hypothetical protein